MSTATHSSKSLKMVIAICAVACLTTATVAWYTSKWFHTKPIEPKNHVNPYMIAALQLLLLQSSCFRMW